MAKNGEKLDWLKAGTTLVGLGLLAWLFPSSPIDPWHLLNPKKIAMMIFALALIQILGSITNRVLGTRTGAILTGFFGGLVSSTATTASLAKKSKIVLDRNIDAEMITFLSATSAMLIEGMALVSMGASDIHLSMLTIFFGPLLVTVIMLYFYSRKLNDRSTKFEDLPFKILPILKLSAFIIAILLFSKLLQNFFGQSGLIILTFLVSLFEVHGSLIANIQLHENMAISAKLLNGLLAISLMASYVSKLFLISALGSRRLKSQAVRCTLILFSSIVFSWIISLFL